MFDVFCFSSYHFWFLICPFFPFTSTPSSLVLSTFLSSCLLSHTSTRISTHTAFGFLFSDKCGFSTERLILNKRRDTVESVAGMAFLLAAERVQTGSYIALDYIIGDTGISQGRYAEMVVPSRMFERESRTDLLYSLHWSLWQFYTPSQIRKCIEN